MHCCIDKMSACETCFLFLCRCCRKRSKILENEHTKFRFNIFSRTNDYGRYYITKCDAAENNYIRCCRKSPPSPKCVSLHLSQNVLDFWDYCYMLMNETTRKFNATLHFVYITHHMRNVSVVINEWIFKLLKWQTSVKTEYNTKLMRDPALACYSWHVVRCIMM